MRSKVRVVIFDVPVKPAGRLRLAELDDGRLAIFRDEAMLSDNTWPAEEVEASVLAFRNLQREGNGKNGDGPPRQPRGESKASGAVPGDDRERR